MQKIGCNNLTISYHRHPVIHHLNVLFKIGHTNAIIGPNGAGKSTLLKALFNEIKIDTGNIIIENIPKNKLAYLPQTNDIDSLAPFTVQDLLCLGLLHTIKTLKGTTSSDSINTKDALIKVGLPNFHNKYIHELSKGQLQRVLMAKIIMQNADIIILDEPFNAMDSKTTADLLKLIHTWQKEGRTIIAVLHDIQQVVNHFEYTLILAHELINFGKTKDIVNQKNLELAYKSNFIQCNIPELCDI